MSYFKLGDHICKIAKIEGPKFQLNLNSLTDLFLGKRQHMNIHNYFVGFGLHLHSF